MNLSQIVVENAFAVLISVLVAFGGTMWKLNGQVASLGAQISGFKETVEKDVARLDGNIIRIEIVARVFPVMCRNFSVTWRHHGYSLATRCAFMAMSLLGMLIMAVTSLGADVFLFGGRFLITACMLFWIFHTYGGFFCFLFEEARLAWRKRLYQKVAINISFVVFILGLIMSLAGIFLKRREF